MGGRRREGRRQDMKRGSSQDFATLCNFSQYKKHTEAGNSKEGSGTGITR